MSEHTQGPWWLWVGEDGSFEVWSLEPEFADRFVICSRNPIDHRAEESRANGRLIGAAPELLDCLVEVLHFFGNPKREEWLSNAAFKQAVAVDDRARAAIAKATGEKP